MLTLTDKARETIDRLIASADQPLTGLKIAVNSGGCSGLQYGMALVETPAADDQVVDCNGTKVYVDPLSVEILSGTTIDFVESLEGSGFTFDNPNAASKCACGKSFAA
ncbi:iron-sulfur cluster assembly accessory protein [Rhodobium orientis]|uniref:Iron-sulfur cluster assembly accessory protein n=1 Tax=Rhodobium orientis TaxID=34017 RepID=A0A327JHP8_9HYPH|nr:iron-sulfur cluster assembly accessory protein [Rhodobium orientis]MBB4304405.1 iron-sulfur cluster assembly accessory protein [Rhodobium orientis]MBK5952011.1 iron-sulfur cluster assembly accessory protein [Rhodobium orientis]RAI25809.1 iron-sulfur cluster assembly accessory protein [Rhodobium orientis]